MLVIGHLPQALALALTLTLTLALALTGRSIGEVRKGATRCTTSSTHAGLYSSSQLMAIVVKAGESAGRCGDHVGLNTFSGKGLFGEGVRGAAKG